MKFVPVKGSGDSPLHFSHITSMAIGSIHYNDLQLDSYQDDDLNQLRNSWVHTLKRQIAFTDKEFRKILTKPGTQLH